MCLYSVAQCAAHQHEQDSCTAPHVHNRILSWWADTWVQALFTAMGLSNIPRQIPEIVIKWNFILLTLLIKTVHIGLCALILKMWKDYD